MVVSDKDAKISGVKRKADAIGRIGAINSCLSSNSADGLVKHDTASSIASGRGAVAGWTTCPLCGRHSQKRYAQGRGIAAHLHAVHTPWKPGKLELKIRKSRINRIKAEQNRQQRRQERKRQKNQLQDDAPNEDTADVIIVDAANNESEQSKQHKNGKVVDEEEVNPLEQVRLEEREPSDKEIEDWDTAVAKIVQSLQQEAATSMANFKSKNDNEGTVVGSTSRMSAAKHGNENAKVKTDDKFVAPGWDRSGKVVKQEYRASLAPFLRAAADGDLQALQKMVHDVGTTCTSTRTGNQHVSDNNGEDDDDKKKNDEKLSFKAVSKLLATIDRHGSSAEHWATGGGHLECLQYLLELRRTCSESTSAESNCIEATEENDDTPSEPHSTPSLPTSTVSSQKEMHATENGNDGITKSKKAVVRRRDGKTCLHYAARNGHVHCARYLVETLGYAVDETSGDGTTALHLGCFGGHLAMVQYLLSSRSRKEKADVHKANEWGCTATHWLAMTRNQDATEVCRIADFLNKEQGVSFFAVQSQGHSPVHKAAQKRNRHVLEWIIKGADFPVKCVARALQLPDKGGHSPLDIWRSMGGEESFAEWMETWIRDVAT